MKNNWKQPPKKKASSAKKPAPNAKPKKKPEPWTPPFPPQGKPAPTSAGKHQIPEVMPSSNQSVIDVPFKEVPAEEPRKAPGTAKRDFIRAFEKLAGYGKHAPWEVWADFIVMTACSISNIVDPMHYEEREKRYTAIVKKYTGQEYEHFTEMLANTILALEDDPEQDFLGQIYMEFGLNNKNLGQEPIPYDVSAMIARISMSDLPARMEHCDVIRLDNSRGGDGGELIASINEARKQLAKINRNFQNHLLVSGQDTDEIVALMSYIQVSLLGVAGFFKVGDSSTDPMASGDSKENYWYTPMYCIGATWQMRRAIYQANRLLRGLMDELE